MTKQDMFTVMLCAGFVTLLVVHLILQVPRLVGYGCDNTNGPIYANQEDHFPLCERIETL